MCDVRAALGLVPKVDEAVADAAREVVRRADDDVSPLYAEDCLPLSVTVGLIVTYCVSLSSFTSTLLDRNVFEPVRR